MLTSATERVISKHMNTHCRVFSNLKNISKGFAVLERLA